MIMNSEVSAPGFDYEQGELHNKGKRFFYIEYNCIYEMGLSVYALSLRGYLLSLTTKDRKTVWPSLKNIASHLGISRNTVKKAVEELIKAGLLKKELRISERGDYANTIYTILDPPIELIYKSVDTKMTNMTQADKPVGGSPDDLPCNDMTGVGHLVTDGVSPNDKRVGHVVITKNNQEKNNHIIKSDLSSLPSLRSGKEDPKAQKPVEDSAVKDSAQYGGSSPEELLQEKVPLLTEGPAPKKKAFRKSETCIPAVTDNSTSDQPGRVPKENTPFANNEGSGITNKDIIGSLGDLFLEVSGMSEAYPPGPKRKRVYALMGRLYHRLDCEPVFRAIDAFKKKIEAGGTVDDPLRYVAGVAEKCAKSVPKDNCADEMYRVIKEIGEKNALTGDKRAFIKKWYAHEEKQGEEFFRKQKEERERLLSLLEKKYDDPLAEEIAEIQREYARKKIAKDRGKFKHVSSCLLFSGETD